MSWTTSLPVVSTRIVDIPAIHSGNWIYLENYLDLEHYGPDYALSGHHHGGNVSVVCEDLSATINALSNVESGALSINSNLAGIWQVYDGSAWKETPGYLSASMVQAYAPTAGTTISQGLTAGGLPVQIILSAEDRDALGEWNTTTSSFIPCAYGYYLYHLMVTVGFTTDTCISAYAAVSATSDYDARILGRTFDRTMTTDCYPIQLEGITPLSAGEHVYFSIANNDTTSGVIYGGKEEAYCFFYRIS